MLLAGTTEASPLKRRVDLTEVDLSGDNCMYLSAEVFGEASRAVKRKTPIRSLCCCEVYYCATCSNLKPGTPNRATRLSLHHTNKKAYARRLKKMTSLRKIASCWVTSQQ